MRLHPVDQDRVTKRVAEVGAVMETAKLELQRRQTGARPGEVARGDPAFEALIEMTNVDTQQAIWRHHGELGAIYRRFLAKLAKLDEREAARTPKP